MPEIEHVIVLALENRSFDHMLGFLAHPDPRFDGLISGGPYTNPGWAGAPDVAATPTAKVVLPVGPDHSHDAAMEQLALQGVGPHAVPTNKGFAQSYERICRGLASPAFGGLIGPLLNWLGSLKHKATPIPGRGPLVMQCQPPSHIPVLSTLALQFAVCQRWFCSVPGETWPNRNYLHAATSDGETDIDPRFYTNRTIFEVLEEAGKTWHIYYDDTPQVWAFVNLWDTDERHANWYEFGQFAEHVAAGQLPTYSFIEPNHRPAFHAFDDDQPGPPRLSTSQHPGNNLVPNDAYDASPDLVQGDFTRADGLIATVYETLRRHPEVFARSLLLITYDEHGGLFDHVAPPTDVPDPGHQTNLLRHLMRAIYHRKSSAFAFTMLGPRVPAVVVSPLIDPGTVSTDVRDHASVSATLRALFAPNAQPLTRRDAWAAPFHTLAARTSPRSDDMPDLSAYLPGGGPPPALAVAGPLPAQAQPAAVGPPDRPPSDYEPFMDLAKRVRRRLARRGVPEARRVPGLPKPQKAQQAVHAFTAEALRIRGE